MGESGKTSCRFSSVRAVGNGGRGAAAVRRQPDPRDRNLELSHGRRRSALYARAPQPRAAAAGATPSGCCAAATAQIAGGEGTHRKAGTIRQRQAGEIEDRQETLTSPETKIASALRTMYA